MIFFDCMHRYGASAILYLLILLINFACATFSAIFLKILLTKLISFLMLNTYVKAVNFHKNKNHPNVDTSEGMFTQIFESQQCLSKKLM